MGDHQGHHTHHLARHNEGHHRDVRDGAARAAVFGISDGLVSNVSLILAVAGAGEPGGTVRLAGLAGLMAGAISMAAGEYVSMRAQTELLERELEMEAIELRRNPDHETAELAAIYRKKGVSDHLATAVATEIHQDLDLALEAHAREELGIDPDELGSATVAAASSFGAFSLGALLPLLPWFFAAGTGAILATVVLASITAIAVGAGLAGFTGRGRWRSATRQLTIAIFAAATTYVLGSIVGTGV